MGGMMDGWVVDDLVLEDEELFVESGVRNQEANGTRETRTLLL